MEFPLNCSRNPRLDPWGTVNSEKCIFHNNPLYKKTIEASMSAKLPRKKWFTSSFKDLSTKKREKLTSFSYPQAKTKELLPTATVPAYFYHKFPDPPKPLKVWDCKEIIADLWPVNLELDRFNTFCVSGSELQSDNDQLDFYIDTVDDEDYVHFNHALKRSKSLSHLEYIKKNDKADLQKKVVKTAMDLATDAYYQINVHSR